uniref:Uncharacterized protein n=1 Tax=Lutzomyia longipalpis TaxID=7200 RepID=A0A1B0GHQ6_LUTLO
MTSRVVFVFSPFKRVLKSFATFFCVSILLPIVVHGGYNRDIPLFCEPFFSTFNENGTPNTEVVKCSTGGFNKYFPALNEIRNSDVATITYRNSRMEQENIRMIKDEKFKEDAKLANGIVCNEEYVESNWLKDEFSDVYDDYIKVVENNEILPSTTTYFCVFLLLPIVVNGGIIRDVPLFCEPFNRTSSDNLIGTDNHETIKCSTEGFSKNFDAAKE